MQSRHQDRCQGLSSPERSRHWDDWSGSSCHWAMTPDFRSDDSESDASDGFPRPTTVRAADALVVDAADDEDGDEDFAGGERAAAADALVAAGVAASAGPVHRVLADCGGAGDAVAAVHSHSGDPFP